MEARGADPFSGQLGGKPYQDQGSIIDMVPNKSFRYQYWSGFSGLVDKKDTYSEVSFQITSGSHNSLLKIKQQEFADRTAQTHSLQGWKEVLPIIKELVESP